MSDGNGASEPRLVGEHVKAALARVGMSQAELARRLGVNESTVSRLVGGDITMTVPTLIEVAHNLELDPCQLIHGDFDAAPCGTHKAAS